MTHSSVIWDFINEIVKNKINKIRRNSNLLIFILHIIAEKFILTVQVLNGEEGEMQHCVFPAGMMMDFCGVPIGAFFVKI